MTSKLIKASLLLFVSILFLTACSSHNTSESSTPTSETNQQSSLDQKIENKQKYIIITKEYNIIVTDTNGHQTFIEKQANFMSSKGYELKDQSIAFSRTGTISEIILTFELKDQ